MKRTAYRRVWRILVLALVVAFSIHGLWITLPSLHRSLFECLGIPYPVVSGRYRFLVINKTDCTLVVDSYNLNDLPFEVDSLEHQMRRLRHHVLWKKSAYLNPGDTHVFTLDSWRDSGLGVILVVARSEMFNTGGKGATQFLSVFQLSPAYSRLKGQKKVPSVEIEPEDLVTVHSAVARKRVCDELQILKPFGL